MSSTDFKLQQQVEILINKPRVSSKSFKGKIIYISKDFITVQNKMSIKESFKFVDFSIGDIQLKH
ncbi:hypothetical protein [Oceanirhabdus sp. W0125-5]|uniref:hypothetical protein n=1 Tax=Oceanirhabdus sp. W0125-5 TaxID=2999116 RepID=UPI0022F2AEA6|nr:hypothetical protein [Oceanirhabdus sp. W0125-5]WBW99641.1 hypothetical protein OW730_13095 [Oceanirhabdus sp. W0125-5]